MRKSIQYLWIVSVVLLLSACNQIGNLQTGAPVITGTETIDIEIGSVAPDWTTYIDAYDVEDGEITITIPSYRDKYNGRFVDTSFVWC